MRTPIDLVGRINLERGGRDWNRFALPISGIAYICADTGNTEAKINALTLEANFGSGTWNSRTWVKRFALPIGGIAYIGANARNTETKINALPHDTLLVQWAGNTIANINVLAHTCLWIASLGK